MKATAGDGTIAQLASALTVAAAASPASVQVHLSYPSRVIPGTQGEVTVSYTNDSNTDALAPLLQISATNALLMLQDQNSFTSNPLWFLGTSANGPAGILRPGESGQISIPYQVTGSNGSQINFNVQIPNDSDTMDWASQQSALQIPTIPDAAWPIAYANFTAAMGVTVGSYHAILAADATYLSQIGEQTYDVLRLVEFEIEKANASYTAQTLEGVTADDLPAPGMDLTFQQSYLDSISGRYYQGLLGAQGWTTNWDIKATTISTGDVSIQISGSYFYFFLQSDGSYLPETSVEGDVLTLTNDAYQLLESDGSLYQFNPNGTLDYMEDPNGNRITASYNSAGKLSLLTDSNGEHLQLSYNGQGQMTTLTDSNGQTETYGYTGQFLTSYTDVYGVTNYSYVTAGNAAQNGALDEIVYAGNTHQYFTYDSEGRLIDEYQDGGANSEQFTYLTPGGLATTDGDGNSTTTYFDLYGATAETIDAHGNDTQYKYDANLNLVEVIAPGGLVSSYTYDANGNETSETDPLGNTTTFTYDSSNDLTSYTDANGNADQLVPMTATTISCPLPMPMATRRVIRTIRSGRRPGSSTPTATQFPPLSTPMDWSPRRPSPITHPTALSTTLRAT